MGQYFKAALIDNEWKVKVINLNGSKLMEHSRYWNESMMRVEKLLYRDARNVMRIWDYSVLAPMVWKHKFEDEEDRREDRYTNDEILKRNWWDYYYLINKSSKEFINMTRQEMNKKLQNDRWRVVHPLPLLTRAETEEAWWGYHSDIWREHIWKRCWDIISIYHFENPLESNLELDWYRDMTNIYFFKE